MDYEKFTERLASAPAGVSVLIGNAAFARASTVVPDVMPTGTDLSELGFFGPPQPFPRLDVVPNEVPNPWLVTRKAAPAWWEEDADAQLSAALEPIAKLFNPVTHESAAQLDQDFLAKLIGQIDDDQPFDFTAPAETNLAKSESEILIATPDLPTFGTASAPLAKRASDLAKYIDQARENIALPRADETDSDYAKRLDAEVLRLEPSLADVLEKRGGLGWNYRSHDLRFAHRNPPKEKPKEEIEEGEKTE
jgi:hypothetical protein